MGGAEHATGHLLYARFWYLFLKDLGLVSSNEPFQKLINQGMILGRSNFVYRINGTNKFVTLGKKEQFETTALHVDVSILENDTLDMEAFRKWRPDYNDAEFITEENGTYVSGWEVEKMSKAKFNVVNPDVLIGKYGADALRLYEMFLGPLEQYKPWNTNGISGVGGFLKKFWRLFHPEDGDLAVTDEPATPAELKALHRAIQKAQEDIEKFSFNTSVSLFMITVNELTALKCHKRAILGPLVVLLSPYAPHLAEELWEELGHAAGSISHTPYPEFREEFLVEDNVIYPLAINGKVREQMQFAAAATAAEIETAVLASDFLTKHGEGKAARKVIVVPGRMVNVVV